MFNLVISDVMKDSKYVERPSLTEALQNQVELARLHGKFIGPTLDYVFETGDFDMIVKAIGRKPSYQEWCDQGLDYVGITHCGG